MANNQGKFVWYELMASDSKAAETFYRSVIGWDMKDAGMPGGPYTILSVGTEMIGGVMPMPDEAAANGARPCWVGYIAVDDVDAYTARVGSAGGTIHRSPEDIPQVGRFSVVADPYGAAFVLFKGSGEPPPSQSLPDQPGRIGWHELHAGDGPAAFAFYSDLFGWTKVEALDMGPLGVYQTFATGDGAPGSAAVGGMLTKTPDTPRAFWLYYFNVESIDAAIARTVEGGGKILMGPHQVPTGSWIVQCFDPQGVMFAMLATKR